MTSVTGNRMDPRIQNGSERDKQIWSFEYQAESKRKDKMVEIPTKNVYILELTAFVDHFKVSPLWMDR